MHGAYRTVEKPGDDQREIGLDLVDNDGFTIRAEHLGATSVQIVVEAVANAVYADRQGCDIAFQVAEVVAQQPVRLLAKFNLIA